MVHCSITSHLLSVFIIAQGMLVLDIKSLGVFSLHVFKHLNTLLQSLISLSHLEYLTSKAYNARILLNPLFNFFTKLCSWSIIVNLSVSPEGIIASVNCSGWRWLPPTLLSSFVAASAFFFLKYFQFSRVAFY